MRYMKFAGSAALFCAMLSTQAMAWKISGHVLDEAGKGIPGADISSFNYAGISGTSDAEGGFFLTNESDAIASVAFQSKVSVQRQGNFLNISNTAGDELTISLMDPLGKITYQNRLSVQDIQLDLSRFAQKTMILLVSNNGNSENYVVSNKGVVKSSLTKVSGPLPSLMFAKDGFENTSYQMKAEVETDVKVTMKKASATAKSSSSTAKSSSSEAKSSSSEAKSSSSVAKSSSSVELIVNCAGKTYQSGDHNMSVNVDGKNRTFIMHVPSAYKGDKAVPLVVDYHPVMGSGSGQLSGTTYKAKTDPEGVISLYPDGTKSADSRKMGPGWNVGPCCSDDDDVKFSREMIKKVQETVCIDPKRIYATGFSMGGGMSNHVTCNMADVYAATAPAAMDLNTVNSAKCEPARPISIIMFRGTNDNVCKYAGGDSGYNDGLNFLGAEKNFKFWADKNGCTGSPTKNSNGCDEYSNCKDGVKVVLCTKQGGGHEQGDGSIGWPFLKSFTMP